MIQKNYYILLRDSEWIIVALIKVDQLLSEYYFYYAWLNKTSFFNEFVNFAE